MDLKKSLRIWFIFSCCLRLFCECAKEAYESDGFTNLNGPGLVFGCHFFGKSFAPEDLKFPLMIWFKISVWDEGLGRAPDRPPGKHPGAKEAHESDGFTHLNGPGLVFG